MTAAVNETPSSTTPRQRTSAKAVGAAIVLFAVIVTMPRDTGPTSLLVMVRGHNRHRYGRERAALFADRAVSARAPAAAPKGRLVTLVLLAIAGHMVGKALLYRHCIS